MSDDEDIVITRVVQATPSATTRPHEQPRQAIVVPDDGGSDDEVIIQGSRQLDPDEVRITRVQRHPRRRTLQPQSQRNGTRQRQSQLQSNNGFYLSLPQEQRYLYMPEGQQVSRGGVRTPFQVSVNETPATRVRNQPRARRYRHSQFLRWINQNLFRWNGGPRQFPYMAYDEDDGFDYDYDYEEEQEGDEIPGDLMDEIQRQEQAEEDSRVDRRRNIADKLRVESEEKARIPPSERSRISNGILPQNDTVCILCGVKLAEGVPEKYAPVTDEAQIKHLLLDEKIRAPWQCCQRLTTVDRNLSKKIFFGKCGHVYCGRCVNNIMRAQKEPKKEKEKRRRRRKRLDLDKVSVTELDFDDPDICAPFKCIAKDCNRPMRSKYFFRELYV